MHTTVRTMADRGISVRGLRKTFDAAQSVIALDRVDLTVREGEFLCIVGPSGCGKTTLLRILAGLELPSEGSVEFAVSSEGRPLQSMVFQEQGLFPWLTAIENAAFGLSARGVSKDESHARARVTLKKLGLGAFEKSYPRQLSGGMRQRVNLARAFTNDPAVLLMDEPLGALDAQMKIVVQNDLLKLWAETRKTVVFITHDIDEAIVLGDRVAVMSRRPGRIKEFIPVPLARPRDVLELRNDVQFIEVRKRIWAALREEVIEAKVETV